jgi:hypothetical protein
MRARVLLALLLSGCPDDTRPDDEEPSVCNHPPRAPVVLAPLGNPEIGDVVVELGPFVDPDGDGPSFTDIEVWRAKDGRRTDRVWRALLSGGVTAVTLADGRFEDREAELGALERDEDYVVRARFGDDHRGCPAVSPFSNEHAFKTADGSDLIFNPDIVHTYELFISPESIAAMNAEALPPGCVRFDRSYQPATLRFNDEVYEVGVHIKGGCGSSRTMSGKPSFRIHFTVTSDATECPVKRRFYGKRALTLNNGVQDPSALHERLGYELYRAAGVPAPRAVCARVVVNGELYGLYTNVESIDRRFLARSFSNNDGMMFEGAYWCDLVPENVPPDDDTFSCFDREFKTDPCDAEKPGRDPTDWSTLATLTEALAGLDEASFYPAIRDLFDWDAFLSMWAADAMLSHWDAYSFHIINNYRIYRNPDDDRWTMMPWGIDQTFDMGGDQNPYDSEALLVRRCLQSEQCRAEFDARLREVIDLFESLQFEALAVTYGEQIRPFIEEDPRKEYSLSSWDRRQGDLADWIRARPERMRAYLP